MPELTRKQINDLYDKQGADALWKWANANNDKERAQRFEALVEWAKDRKHAIDQKREDKAHDRNVAEHALEHLDDEKRKLLDKLKDARAGGRDTDVKRLEADLGDLKRKLDSQENNAHKATVREKALEDTERAWLDREIIYRKQVQAARAEIKAGRKPEWEPWMCNGCPTNITPEAKQFMAIAVVQFNCVVTTTTNGTHVVTSFHYPRNNAAHGYSDELGHAFDLGGPLGTYDKFYVWAKAQGCDLFDELFGPGDGYCDGCAFHSGAAPDNPNHTHCAPKAAR
jgi:hypothetical protein